MAIHIDVITGFLENGKTTFINEMLDSSQFKEYERIVLLVCEEGSTEYDRDKLKDKNVRLVGIPRIQELNEQFMKKIAEEYEPDYVLVEFNGTWDIGKLLSLKFPRFYKIRNVIFLGEAGNFKNHLSNMAGLIQPQILNSDAVLFNRYDTLRNQDKKELPHLVNRINGRTKVYFYKDFNSDYKIQNYFTPFEKYQRITPGMIIDCVILLVLCFIPLPVLGKMFDYIHALSTVFLSILLQALPFILFGAFISAAIQILIPTAWIRKGFAGNTAKSFFFAGIAGFFLPICDCGMVPVVTGLLRKETPLPQTITFWLTSAAVNPIVILSVIYAFPDKPYIAAVRILSGISVGILVGLLLKLSKTETKDVILNTAVYNKVGADRITIETKGWTGKCIAVIDGAKIEFFRIFRYVILGAFFSVLFQGMLSRNMKDFLGGNVSLQLVFMITVAVFLSVCSTSNAFIGRSFLSSISMVPILSFIVLGPMLDFKNMLLLSELLKKGFLLKLSVMVIGVGIFVFSIVNRIL